MSTLKFLRTFVAIAEHGSFAAAAERVALTHAAVGQQMRALEAEMGRPLFDRSQRSITLRAEGIELLPKAKQLLADYESMVVNENVEAIVGTVTVGAIISGLGLLARCLVTIKGSHPALGVNVMSGKSEQLAQMVESGELDAAVLVEQSSSPPRRLAWTRLYQEPLVLLANARLTRKHDGWIDVLRDFPFIRYDKASVEGAHVEKLLRRHHIGPTEVLELDALIGIADLVRQEVGVSIVPNLFNFNWRKDRQLRVIDLPGPELARNVGILENGRKAYATATIREHMLESLKNLG